MIENAHLREAGVLGQESERWRALGLGVLKLRGTHVRGRSCG